MSNMKNGISTLNRWWGKKNKDKSPTPNGKFSKSSTNLSLSISTTNINETSQLEYNRIAPLPAVTSNAPFEQTFRITVLLPKDQLYVTRLGARVPLSKLLELVCDHKSLDAQKYEFRNPVDPSQVYSCDLTIGAMGLSEIRLCHKSESYDTFNTDEVMKLHRTSVIRDSLSSSEFSSRNSKHTTKTASPYSSSNSLNSMDSTGMNYTRTPVSPPPALPKSTPPKMAAPPRKKRAAPRPPSQVVIPEKDALVIEHEAAQTEQTIETLKQQQESMSLSPRKDYYASTPNLTVNSDSNGNRSSLNTPSPKIVTNGNVPNFEINTESTEVSQKNARNLCGGSVQDLSSLSPTEQCSKFPEPSPRKRLIQIKKKSAPAPPTRGGEDSISIASTPDTPGTAESEKALYLNGNNICDSPTIANDAPKPVVRESTVTTKQSINTTQSSTPVQNVEIVRTTKVETTPNVPKPVPRSTTTTLLNATSNDSHTSSTTPDVSTHTTQHSNVSKVLLNRTPTPEPRSLSCEPPDTEEHFSSLHTTATRDEDDNVSKQADSGIGEPVPSPIPDSLPSEGSAHECKSTFESSSDDDDMVKTYNFKLGKTTVKGTPNVSSPKTIEELQALQIDSGEVTPSSLTHEPTPNASETTSWNFTIPISPPPNFADNATSSEEKRITTPTSTDKPITPKIVERPVLNFDGLSTTSTMETSKDVADHIATKVETPIEKCPRTPLPSPSTPINEIIDELSTILNEKRMDTLIKKYDEQNEIESAKPNTLSNFTITALTTQQSTKHTDVVTSNETASHGPTTPESTPDEEKLYKKRGSITNGSSGLKQLKSISRADSFHTTSAANQTQEQNALKATDSTNGLNSRSASYLSLTKLEQNGGLSRRRSSSELSIGESPSLQSLEVIKTILNSRKNSLANSSDGESKQPAMEVIQVERQASTEQSKISSVELKPKPAPSVSAAIDEPQEPTKPKEVPKVYRYSGPPSINFSTWSERPKVQVAIKNEGDYIFGGKNAGSQNAAVTRADVEFRTAQTMPRNQRVSTPEVFTFAPPVPPKPTATSPIQRMGIPEKEYHVPVTVKPLKDVTVESVETHTNKTNTPSVTKVTLNGENIVSNKTETITNSKFQSTQAANTSTLPRAGHKTNRFSMPAKHATPGPGLLRSTSITQLDANQKTTTRVETEVTAPAPFGQNTLRKTGLKEKILAKEEQAQKQHTNVTVNAAVPTQPKIAATPTKVSTTTISNGIVTVQTKSMSNQKPFVHSTKALQSAKLELKLQESTPVYTQHNGNATPKVITPKSAPPAPAPPMPPMPVLKSVTLRSQSANAATTPTNGDTRDALLESIRNFKRTELNRV